MIKLPPPRLWIPHSLLPLIALAVLAVLFERTDWDFALTDPFYDFAAQRWPYKASWWAQTLIHVWGKRVVAAVVCAAIGVAVAARFVRALAPWFRPALFLALSILFSTGLVSLGKRYTNRHCPWEYTRYNGPVPYTRLLEPAPEGFKAGHCFPAGHASGGFAFLATYFLFYERNGRWAFAGLLLGLSLGVLFAFGQHARGAHFASHNVYTVAVCWFVPMGLYQFAFRANLWPHTADRESDTPAALPTPKAFVH